MSRGRNWLKRQKQLNAAGKRDIYRGLYKNFAHDEMNKYAYCKITELRADENVLYIGIEE